MPEQASDKPRYSPAFAPDERSLGGAQAIRSTYVNHHRRTYRAESAIPVNKPQVSASDLSRNRERRLGATDRTLQEHVNNVYHMHRRIENAYSLTERKKNTQDASIYPVYQKRSNNAVVESVQVWKPKKGQDYSNQRPSSAPTTRSQRYQRYSTGPPKGDGYVGWSVGPSLIDAWPRGGRRDENHGLPPTINKEIYKRAMMAEILEQRLYRSEDLRALFNAYIRHNPAEHRPLVRDAIMDIREELEV